MESSPIIEQAYELLARASSTSEVLTLNLTNLFILIILKLAIFGFGFVSLGSNGRSADGGQDASLTSSDLTGGMCFMMYTSGAEEKLSCIQRSACEDPKTATDYLTAAKMWHKISKLMGSDMRPMYVSIMDAVADATEHSQAGGDCSAFKW